MKREYQYLKKHPMKENEKIIDLLNLINDKVELISKELVVLSKKGTKSKYGGIELVKQVTGYSKNYIYKLCHLKQIPHVKRGSKLFFNTRELERWIEKNKLSK